MVYFKENFEFARTKILKYFHRQTWRYFSPVLNIDGASYFVLTFSQQSRHKDKQKLAPTSADSLYMFGLCGWQGLCLGCQLWGKRTQQKSWDAESFIDSRNYLQVQLLWPRCTLTNTTDTTPTDTTSALSISHHILGHIILWCVWWWEQMKRAEVAYTTFPPPTNIFHPNIYIFTSSILMLFYFI